ncbi:OmpP1/FadL family transporter [Alloalcanivorax profundimaris]|uniref:OmpP1/FadL family transporter n=1 Tax=Alloalcanivorax profundimaris TaxID=2735259 RepID=UPI001E54647C|nr:outer membrane protein transport protein [Alloalcanivorax profundimaris]
MMKIRGALLATSVLSLASGSAFASGFGVSYQSVSAMGTAYAGSGVLSEDATNQWYNPATLAGLHDAQFSLATHQVWIDTSFKADGASGPGDFEDVEPFVGSVFLAVPFNDRVTFGLGINAPFGTKIEYEDNWGNANAGPSAPFFPTTGDPYAQTSDVQTINVNPAMGIQVTDNLRLGVGLNYQRIDADIENSATRLEGDDDAFGWNAGLTFSPDDNNHFGVSYRSEISYDIDGDITFKDAAVAASAAAGGVPAAGIPTVVADLAGKYSGETSLDLPAILQLSYAGDLTDRTQLLLGVEHTYWSSLDRLVVDHSGTQTSLGGMASLPNPSIEEFDWDDTTRYSIGLRHTLPSDTVLRFGLAKEESTQSSDNRSAISPDSDRVWATLGAGFRPTENLSIDVAYAHIWVDDADVYKTSRGAVLDGTYELDANVIGAQLNYTF